MSTVPDLFSTRSKVYEMKLDELSSIDSRWSTIKSSFFRSCSFPSNNQLPEYDVSQFERAKQGLPDERKDSWTEYSNKVISRISRVFWGNNISGGWTARNGKFARNSTSVEGVVSVAKELSSLLGEDLENTSLRGNYYYPKGGYREWHTNQYDPLGWRLYFVHIDQSECATFNYIDPVSKARHQCTDTDGMMRLFYVGSGDSLLWHSIVSDGNRWSLGFILNEASALKLINMADRKV